MNTPIPEPQPQPQPQPTAPAPAPTPAPAPAPAPVVSAAPLTASAPSPKASESPSGDARLAQSIKDAYTLLDFSCRRGASLDGTLSTTLVDSYNKLQNSAPITMAEEVAFWAAFSKITEQVKPVTVESILFTNPAPEASKKAGLWEKIFKHTSPAERTLRHYLIYAIATLSVLLVLQVEWAIGSFIYNDAYKVHSNLLSTQDDLISAIALSKSVKGTPAATNADDALKKAQNLLEMDQSWSDVSYVRLWWWNRDIVSYVPPRDLILHEYENNKNSSPSLADGLIQGTSGMKLNGQGMQRLEYTRAELTLQVLSNYLLVTLFALLGAQTQALRTLSHLIQNVSLTANDLYRVRTRVILGVISGVCMAWLYIISTEMSGSAGKHSPLDAINFLGAFAPWAIAFIAGYSVEIFFALLERVISIITDKIHGLSAQPSPAIEKPIPEPKPAPKPVPTPAPAPVTAT